MPATGPSRAGCWGLATLVVGDAERRAHHAASCVTLHTSNLVHRVTR
jgi:hypothetical protein